jgi:hypothetical protein
MIDLTRLAANIERQGDLNDCEHHIAHSTMVQGLIFHSTALMCRGQPSELQRIKLLSYK